MANINQLINQQPQLIYDQYIYISDILLASKLICVFSIKLSDSEHVEGKALFDRMPNVIITPASPEIKLSNSKLHTIGRDMSQN